MADPNENLGVGGGAPPLGNPLAGMEAEEKALKKGRGRMMAGMIIGVLIAVAALVWFMAPDDKASYAQFGRKINGLDTQHFDQFWACALQNVDQSTVRSDRDLRSQISKRASVGKARYGAAVRDRCMNKLRDMEPKLEALIPPDDLAQGVRDLHTAVTELRGGWSEFIGHLDGLGDEPYDADNEPASLGKIAKGWYDYKRAHSGLNKTIRAKLNQ